MTPDLWTSWSFQPPILVGLGAAAWAYRRGVGTLWSGGRRRGITSRQVASFAAGLVVLFIALVSPLHSAAGELLWAHMVQHVLLVLVAAPLLVLGAPVIPMTLALPISWRRRIRRWGRIGSIRWAGRVLSLPVIAWLLAFIALWAWHAPSPYDAAARSEVIHALEHMSFLTTSILFWWVAFRPATNDRLSGGSQVIYVLAAGVQSGALGAVLTFASTPLYSTYAHTIAGGGLTPLQDQQLAGLIMWIPSGVIYMVVGGALFVRWLLAIERETRRAEGRTGTLGLLGERR